MSLKKILSIAAAVVVVAVLFVGGVAYAAITPSGPILNYAQLLGMILSPPQTLYVSPKTATAATPVHAMPTPGQDIEATYQTNGTVQEIVVNNLSDTYICVKPFVVATACGASGLTCNALTVDTNGQPIAPETPRKFRLTGKEHLCVIAEGAALTKYFVAERSVLKL